VTTIARCRAVDDAEQRTDREAEAKVDPRLQVFPRPLVHADLAAAAALAAANEQRSATVVEVRLVERQRFMDAQARSPQHDDQTTQPATMAPVTRRAHDRDDLLHGRRIGRVAVSLVTWRAASVKAGMVAGDRRRPAASSSNSVMTPPRARRRAASIAEESWAEDIALDAQRGSRFASVALAAAVLSGPSDLPHRDSDAAQAPPIVCARRAYAPDATAPAEWDFRWSSGASV
jgi:hypothetical protein